MLIACCLPRRPCLSCALPACPSRLAQVKRAFSFKRKKQRNENQQSANAPAAATPAAALSAIKRSFSFGRRSRGEKENAPAAAPYVDTLGMGDDEPVLAPREQVIESPSDRC